jgi:hypothetical protein
MVDDPTDNTNNTIAMVAVEQHEEGNDDPTLLTAMDPLAVTESSAVDDSQNIDNGATSRRLTIDNDIMDGDKDNEADTMHREDYTIFSSPTATSDCVIPDPSSIPISVVRCYHIEKYDFDTNITVQLFQEQYVVTCSQANDGKITTWLLCQPVLNMYSLKRQLQWEVSHLLGGGKRDDALLTVYCQRISTLLWERLNTEESQQQPYQPKPILFGFTLWKKEMMLTHGEASHTNHNSSSTASNVGTSHDPELFHTIVDMVVKTILEAMASNVES